MPDDSPTPSNSLSFQPPAAARLRLFGFARTVGALAMFVVGGVHLEQYYVAYFRVVPTIGSLFLANFIGATVVGLVLLIPVRPRSRRAGLLLDVLAAVAAIALAVGAFAGLLVSEHTPLFGFMEHGYRFEILLALAAEAVATASLTVVLACIVRWTPRRRTHEHPNRRASGPVTTPTAREA